MSLRIALLFFSLLISIGDLRSAAVAQETSEGSSIEGPVEGLIGPAVEMNSDLRDLLIEWRGQRELEPIEVPLQRVPFPELAAATHGDVETQLAPPNSVDPFKTKKSALSKPNPNFDGISLFDPGAFFVPPDTNGDVGPNHYVQTVNSSIAVFDKQGNTLAGPLPLSALFTPLGGSCVVGFPIDPIVNYDPLADRWLVLGFPFANPICIAVSQTGDPVTGGWFLYEFHAADFPDYPKLGVWPDAYYLSTQFGTIQVYALDRSSMLNGDPIQFVHFSVEPPFLLPADLDGRPPKPRQLVADLSGRQQRLVPPAPFVRHVDGDVWGGVDRLEVFEFRVNFEDPASSSFELVANLPTEPFRAVLCGDSFFGDCAEQPNGVRLETLPVWLMWRLQYRSFSNRETLVVNHTIAVDSALGEGAGIRWYELRRRHRGPWTIFQQGTFAPQDPAASSFLHRWMGSIAMDKKGNIALGFSATSSDVFPSVRYVGRTAKDPLGLMPQGEPPDGDLVMIAGENSSIATRWGDYSSMSVDPEDGCTFWYTQEYIGTDLDLWRTRIGAFRFPSCH